MGDLGDGRLELDELGSVIDHASSLDAPARTELLEGNDATTWSERLESTGVTPWLRRYRVPVAAGAAVVVLLGAAGTAWVRSRPPEQITAVSVDVTDWVSDGTAPTGVVDMGAGVLQASFRATPLRLGDSVRILGMVGPGVRASKVRLHSDTTAEDGSSTGDVSVVIGCDDPELTNATPDSFKLTIEETDPYGRTTTGTASLPAGSAGQWVDITVAPCAQRQITELVVPTSIEISGSLATRTIITRVTLRNDYGHDLAISAPQGQQSAVYTAGDLTVLGKQDTAVAPVRMRVSDCANPHLDDAYVPDDGQGGNARSVAGVNLIVAQNDLLQSFGATIVARFSRAQQQQVASLLAQMCRGVPAATPRVLIAGTSPIDPDVEFTSSGDPATVGLRLSVDVATTAQRVRVSDGLAPEDVANGALSTISTAEATVRDGHARLSIDWAVSCSNVANPPTVQILLTSGSRTWPVRASLPDASLLAAYRVACPGLQEGDYSGLGWTTA